MVCGLVRIGAHDDVVEPATFRLAAAAQAAAPGPTAEAPARAGVPRYYIEQGFTGGNNHFRPVNVVRATATGAVPAGSNVFSEAW
jgi:hypothetical protein